MIYLLETKAFNTIEVKYMCDLDIRIEGLYV